MKEANLALYVFFAKNTVMKIAVISDTTKKSELLEQGLQPGTEIVWLDTPGPVENADAYIDLLFRATEERLKLWTELKPTLLLLNEVVLFPQELLPGCICFNGWNSLLKRPVIEASSSGDAEQDKAQEVFSGLGKKVRWVNGQRGFISARVISMIINEAYHALGEKISTREEIDTAMKLGTNYPFGPFEWSRQIGLNAVHELLQKLASEDPRYEPASLLKNEATGQ
jgi:3-hydroxybutyryl-CoA dehydrogenase